MPFEEELGEALRHTGDSFAPHRQTALVDAGELYGRRLVRRRRAAVAGGSLLALAVIGTTGAFTTGLLGGGGDSVRTSVAAPGEREPGDPAKKEWVPGKGNVSGDEIVRTLTTLLRGGTLGETTGRGTAEGATAAGVYDDGKGRSAVSIGFWRLDPAGDQARELTTCPSATQVPHDGCTAKNLPGGGRLLVIKGYEYPDKREPTKSWRATFVTRQGHVVDAGEWNAPAQKGAAVSRPEPPLDPAALEALVTSDSWAPVLLDLNAPPVQRPNPDTPKPLTRPVLAVLRDHLPSSLQVLEKDGGGEGARVVVDDGKGKFHVTVQLQQGMGDVVDDLFGEPDVTTLPDGTKVNPNQRAGEKGGAGVVWWDVDTIRPDGLRIVVSAFNSPAQHLPATRPEPGVTMKLLQEIATDPRLTRGK
ncbi:hypothetical protein LG634_14405 [Streptomyces bambusae]|uniref:hypothetical protein n=1 Tax=Streptomyces bambusae TaxID=1550616 RepID=UPI001CFEA1DB|nr:hypothetical protein [Streptomyces bambusae]MCB5166023.1 hypothetical protein [Streptomyces bambusae]